MSYDKLKRQFLIDKEKWFKNLNLERIKFNRDKKEWFRKLKNGEL